MYTTTVVGTTGVTTTIGQETIGAITIIGVGIMVGMVIIGVITIGTDLVGDGDGITGMDQAGMVIMAIMVGTMVDMATTIIGVGTMVI
jgi:hypothetical protein